MVFAARTSLAAATTPIPENLVDLTTSSAGCVAGASGSHKTYPAYKAFDNGSKSADGSRWLATKADNMYVTYKFKVATVVNGIGIFLPTLNYNCGVRAPNTWTFSGSNDGETWTTLDTRTGETGWSKGEFRHYEFRARMPFQYYKFNCTALNGNTECLQVSELEFYFTEPDGPSEATWTGAGDTDFLDDAGNWNSEVPGLSTFATIAATGSKDAVVPSKPMAIKQLFLGSGGSAVLRQTNGVFAVLGGGMTIGRLAHGNGLLSVSGGTFVSTNGTSFLGARTGTGTIDVSGSGRVEFDQLPMGYATEGNGAHGILRLSENGECSAGETVLGRSTKSLGEIFISGNGMFSTRNNVSLGYISNATGVVFQTGGTFHGDKIIYVGYEPGGVGRYEMTGGACNTGTGLSIGRYGTGTFIVSGYGTVLTVGSSASGLDGVRIGFSLNNHAGTGTLVVTNGGKVVAQSLYRGSGAGANQAYVTFDEGIVQATADTATFLNNLANIDLKVGGLAIESEGHNLGIANCTFNVTHGAKISVTGGGTMTFTDTTVNLAEKPTRGLTFAETDGTFSGLPARSGSGGWKLKMSEDSKRIRILPLGLLIIVQ